MATKKDRVPIPDDVAAAVIYESDRTCCVCRLSGKAVQIHHINEDPSDNDPANLAVLCLECHDQTQIRGGFGRKLNAHIVTLYRDSWIDIVRMRRSSLTLRSELAGVERSSFTAPRIATPALNDSTNERKASSSTERDPGISGGGAHSSRSESPFGYSYRHLGIVITLIDVTRARSILVEKRNAQYDDDFEEQYAGHGAEYVSLVTRVLNDANVSIDLTCGYPIGNKLVDSRGREFDAIDELYKVVANPKCNDNLQPGFETGMTWIYRVPESVETRSFDFEDLTDWDAPRSARPTSIPAITTPLTR
ncbi:HNH endonuclease signature motif containing protein [Actinomadura sp. LOL_016]|uniref:HNH endonuclease signature motif containing protein n=1 Tax=unclassified Actinomadura TaxID=2626254 RepID=UPI003A813389